MAQYHVVWSPKPGKLVPLMFKTEAARKAFLDTHPGKATVLHARSAPKKSVGNVRLASQIGSAS